MEHGSCAAVSPVHVHCSIEVFGRKKKKKDENHVSVSETPQSSRESQQHLVERNRKPMRSRRHRADANFTEAFDYRTKQPSTDYMRRPMKIDHINQSLQHLENMIKKKFSNFLFFFIIMLSYCKCWTGNNSSRSASVKNIKP